TIFLPLALVGVLMTISSLWDAAIDPFIGHWSDTTRSRWGRRRPFLLFAAPVAAFSMILLWTPPQNASTTLTAAYFLTILLTFNTAKSLIGIPYDASLPEMASSPRELLKLSTWKNIFGLLGVLTGALVTAPLFDSNGPALMGLVVGGIALLTIWLSLSSLRETKKSLGDPMPIIESIKTTLKNRQFIYLLLTVLAVQTAYAMVLANLPFFVTLLLKREEGDVGTFLGILVVVMLISAPIWLWLSKRYSSNKLMTISLIGLGVAIALSSTVGLLPTIPRTVHGIIALILSGPVLGGYFILAFAIMGNVVDYDELFTNTRREAIYYGTFSLASSIGPALSALIIPKIFNTFGYTSANPTGVRVALLVAATLSIIGALIFSNYKLGDTLEESRRNMGIDV
ncbi:MAG TPA: MFS transporter, partial [Anaerolineae bacterium]|nr:MFS transporter [Anaerolineae bacterium]